MDNDDRARLEADRALVAELATEQFTGWKYEVFKKELWAYGYTTMTMLIRRGEIFQDCAEIGRAVETPAGVREHLATDPDDAYDLAEITVRKTVPFFRKKALIQGGWNPDKGATLTTYFTGACKGTFPNVYRFWLKEHLLRRRQIRYGLTPEIQRITSGSSALDPADATISEEYVREALEGIHPATAHALKLISLFGLTRKEAAKAAGLTENALQKRLKRLQPKTSHNPEGGSR